MHLEIEASSTYIMCDLHRNSPFSFLQSQVLLWTSWQQFLALGMSAMSSPWANLILALLTVLVWLMKHHKQQESESELLFHALTVDGIFRYTVRHLLKEREKFT